MVDIIEIKPIPGDHESNFKKVGAIPSEPSNSHFALAITDIKSYLWLLILKIICFTRMTYFILKNVSSPTSHKNLRGSGILAKFFLAQSFMN